MLSPVLVPVKFFDTSHLEVLRRHRMYIVILKFLSNSKPCQTILVIGNKNVESLKAMALAFIELHRINSEDAYFIIECNTEERRQLLFDLPETDKTVLDCPNTRKRSNSVASTEPGEALESDSKRQKQTEIYLDQFKENLRKENEQFCQEMVKEIKDHLKTTLQDFSQNFLKQNSKE